MASKQTFPPVPRPNYDDTDGTKRVWALLATLERNDRWPSEYSGGTRHLRFSFVSVPGYHGAGQADSKSMRNELESPFYHLELTSQGDRNRPGVLYGYGAEYRGVHSMDARKCQAYARFLTTLEARLDAIKADQGPPADYAAWVVRVATVLRVRYLVIRDADAHSSSYSDGGYDVHSLYQHGGAKGYPVDKLDGDSLYNHVRGLTYQLWNQADREAAKAYAEHEAAVEAESEAARKAGESAA